MAKNNKKNAFKTELKADFVKSLQANVELEAEDQEKHFGPLLVKAILAMGEMDDNRRILMKMLRQSLDKNSALVEDYSSFIELHSSTQKEFSDFNQKLYDEYEKSVSMAEDNLTIFESNQEILLNNAAYWQAATKSDVASQIGRSKGQEVRGKAYEYLREALNEQPNLSINRLATMLEVESENDLKKFGKFIPTSTGKGYARTIKKEVESGSR